MLSPEFQVFSIERLLSTPFSFAHTLAAARAVLFSPNSTTEYKLPSSLRIRPLLISDVVAIGIKFKAAKIRQHSLTAKVNSISRKDAKGRKDAKFVAPLLSFATLCEKW